MEVGGSRHRPEDRVRLAREPREVCLRSPRAADDVLVHGWGITEVGLDVVVLLGYDFLTLFGAGVFARRQT